MFYNCTCTQTAEDGESNRQLQCFRERTVGSFLTVGFSKKLMPAQQKPV